MDKERMAKIEKTGGFGFNTCLVLALLFFCFILASFVVVYAAPEGPTSINQVVNETKTSPGAFMLNTSGGYITTLNFTARTQDVRWKAFVGYVTGKFALDDASGSTIYDWSLSSVSGEVYATRNSSTTWGQIKCANKTVTERENGYMFHSNIRDNITATFFNSTHPGFFVGSVNISLNTCPSLNTYINNASSGNFSEVALFDGVTQASGSLVYATILEQHSTGFDGQTYDFQMIVPEDGSPGFSGATAYYLYVEIT